MTEPESFSALCRRLGILECGGSVPHDPRQPRYYYEVRVVDGVVTRGMTWDDAPEPQP